MSLPRALFAALAALCLAILFVGTAPASAHGLTPHPVAVQADTNVDAPALAASAAQHQAHQHGTAHAADRENKAAAAGHCDDKGDAPGTSSCCGFACHAVAPVHQTTFGVAARQLSPVHLVQDEQVGASAPSSLERPPRHG